MKIAILTDTNSGIGIAEANTMGIELIPMPIIVDDETYYEGINLSADALCQYLTEGRKVSTSQPATGDLLKQWDGIFKKGYDEIIYIPMSSGLSSSCICAKAIASDYDGKIHVVDNHRISVTQRTSVMKARKLADSGMNAEEISSYLEKDAFNSSIYVSVDNLEFLKRGGRITPGAAAIAGLLHIKPILTIQGEKLDSYSKIRGSIHRCEAKMLDAIQEDITQRFSQPGTKQIHIGAAGFGIGTEESEHWLTMVSNAFPDADVYYDSLPASIGVHTGPGTAGIGISVDYE